jgi:carbon storage regulator
VLVLSRAQDEVIIINHNIRVVVCQIGSGKVKIGIEAPAGVSVNREEIERRIETGIAAS